MSVKKKHKKAHVLFKSTLYDPWKLPKEVTPCELNRNAIVARNNEGFTDV